MYRAAPEEQGRACSGVTGDPVLGLMCQLFPCLEGLPSPAWSFGLIKAMGLMYPCCVSVRLVSAPLAACSEPAGELQ